MTVYSHTTGFTRGEVEASLFDRFDVDFYRSANKRVDNWFPDVTGALERRPAVVPLGDNPFFILPVPPGVTASPTDCGEFHMRSFLFRDKEFLLVFRRICADGWQTVTASCYRLDESGPVAQFEDVFLVFYSNVSTDLATLLSGNLPPDSHDGNLPFEFSAGLAQNVCFVQVGPSMFVTSPLFPPYRVFVDNDNEASIERIFWFEELLGTIAINNNTSTWNGTDTLLNEQLAVGNSFFFQGEEFTVASVTSAEQITSNQTYSGLTLAGERINIKTNRFDTDWPRLCTFHKGRLFLFSTRLKPVGMFASKAGNPFVIIAGSVYDDSPINVELFTAGAESFNWVDAANRLVLGGGQSEYVLDALPDAPITPTTFSFYKVSSIGGASLQPFASNASTIFVSRGRTKVQAVRFEEARAGFVGEDISLLSPHLLANQVRDIVFRPGTRSDRAPRIFLLTDAKELRTCTFSETENVIAWSRISFADGYEVQAIATSPDDLYALVKCPNGTLVLSELDVGSTEFYLIDMEFAYTATAGVVALNDIHKDTTVAVLDGSRFVGYFEVTNTLDIGEEDFNGELIVGITYASNLEMLPVVLADTFDGGTLNRKHRLVRVIVSVEEAYEMSVNNEPLFGTLAVNDVTGFKKRNGSFERRFLGWTERPETTIAVSSLYRAKLRSVTREVNI